MPGVAGGTASEVICGKSRPGLEYASPAWCKDIDSLEKAQKRCLRLSRDEIVLPSLKERRENQDMVETYKMLTRQSESKPEIFFSHPDSAREADTERENYVVTT